MIRPEQPLYEIPEGWRLLAVGEYKEPGDIRRSKKATEWEQHYILYGGGPIVAEETYFFFRRTIPLPAEPIPPKPTYEEIEAALIKANDALNYVGLDKWEMECLGDDLAAIGEIVGRIEANKGKTA